jgi:hypothetical protein
MSIRISTDIAFDEGKIVFSWREDNIPYADNCAAQPFSEQADQII